MYIKVIKLRQKSGITKDPTRQLVAVRAERTHSLPRASAPLAYNARFRVSQETGKKKDSRNESFSTFLCATLKRIYVSVV